MIDAFDRYVYESVVDKVIVGGNKDPAIITFVYKTGLPKLCSHSSDDTCRSCYQVGAGIVNKELTVEL